MPRPVSSQMISPGRCWVMSCDGGLVGTGLGTRNLDLVKVKFYKDRLQT
jgi:hypothetical protein